MSEQSHDVRRWNAVARIHQALFTGLLLRIQVEQGTKQAAAFLRTTFHAQHDEKFLLALKSLGLDSKSDPIACAQFFYLANLVGGVDVQCMVENERKAWIRYPPPRWAYVDASICAVPNEVTIAMMRGFHARCGDSLGNPRLGFVCTGMTSNGDPGLEGYFIEEDRELQPEEKLRFDLGKHGPAFDPASAPRVDWDEARRVKAKRNYSLAYIKQMLPAMRAVAGDDVGAAISGRAARLVGLQLFAEMAKWLGGVDRGAEGFASYLAEMINGGGDRAEVSKGGGGIEVRQRGWRLMAGSAVGCRRDFEAWSELWTGACAVHDRTLRLEVSCDSPDEEAIDQSVFVWRIVS